jgi:hypothetical protein
VIPTDKKVSIIFKDLIYQKAASLLPYCKIGNIPKWDEEEKKKQNEEDEG